MRRGGGIGERRLRGVLLLIAVLWLSKQWVKHLNANVLLDGVVANPYAFKE